VPPVPSLAEWERADSSGVGTGGTGKPLETGLSNWIAHRQKLLGIDSHQHLAEISVLPISTIASIIERRSLDRVGRSARMYLARALEVSVRDLEALSGGKIDWISDDHRIDAARMTPASLRTDSRVASSIGAAVSCAPSQGVPIVGRIDVNGNAQLLEDWSSENLSRLPIRYRGMPDAFALWATSLPENPPQNAVIFRGVPPGQLPDRQLALITRGDADESLYCYVEREGDLSLRLITPAGEEGPLVPMELIVRAARVIGTHAP
jgi:hypothetical protein